VSHGQEHFCNSTFTSLKKFLVFVIMGIVKSSNQQREHRTFNIERRMFEREFVLND
jgi:hypothetical protein